MVKVKDEVNISGGAGLWRWRRRVWRVEVEWPGDKGQRVQA